MSDVKKTMETVGAHIEGSQPLMETALGELGHTVFSHLTKLIEHDEALHRVDVRIHMHEAVMEQLREEVAAPVSAQAEDASKVKVVHLEIGPRKNGVGQAARLNDAPGKRSRHLRFTGVDGDVRVHHRSSRIVARRRGCRRDATGGKSIVVKTTASRVAPHMQIRENGRLQLR